MRDWFYCNGKVIPSLRTFNYSISGYHPYRKCMITHDAIDEWFNRHFSHMTSAQTQNARAELHDMLPPEKLEDKITGGDMKKIAPEYTPELAED